MSPVAVLASSGLLLAACAGAPSATPGRAVGPARPVAIDPGPKGLIAAAAPQPDGYMWLLANTDRVATLQELNLTTGKVVATLPESSAADSVTQSPSGIIAVGLDSGTAGAVELRRGTSGGLVSTIPMAAPVKAVFAGEDGSTVYVLVKSAQSASVVPFDVENDQASTAVPVPSGTVAIAVDPTEEDLYALTGSGTVDDVALGDGSVQAGFAVGQGAVQLAIDNTGSSLYVLKATGSGANVGIIDLATERQLRVIAAPAHCTDIQVSLNSQDLYDVVGTSTYGNVQVFPLGT